MRRIRAGKQKLFYRSNLFFLGLLPALHFGAAAPQAPTARRCRRLARRRSSVMRNDNTLRCVCALLRAFRRVEMNEFSLGFFVHPSIFFPSWKYKLLFLGNLSLSLSLFAIISSCTRTLSISATPPYHSCCSSFHHHHSMMMRDF